MNNLLYIHISLVLLRYQLKFAGGKDKGSCFSSWSRARSVASRRPSLARMSMITATDTLPGLSRKSEADALYKGETESAV